MDYKDKIKSYLDTEIETLKKLDIEEINKAMNLLEETRKNGNVVYTCGNGGSASTASHIKNDFAKGISYDLKHKYNFVSLSDNIATIMAIANDDSYDQVFYKQIENIIRPNDVLLAISGSGNSKNVIKAVEYAKSVGCKVIGMTGYSGGKLKELSDIKLHVPLDNMQVAEDIHTIFNHCMMHILCNILKGNKDE